MTESPNWTVVGFTEAVVVVGIDWTTSNPVVPLDPPKSEFPSYVPVIVSLPAGADIDVQEPFPSTKLAVVHNLMLPLVKVTVPVGSVPPLATLTLAE